MRQKGLIACLIGSMLGLFGCAMKKMPEGELVNLSYTRSGTMAGYEYEGRVEKDSTGTFVLRAMKENYGPLFEKKLGPEELHHFRQIIEDAKMYQYKEAYRPRMEVLDGWGWSLTVRFSDGNSIYSHGFNASPSGNGLATLRGYMDQLIQDGVQIEFPEEDE